MGCYCMLRQERNATGAQRRGLPKLEHNCYQAQSSLDALASSISKLAGRDSVLMSAFEAPLDSASVSMSVYQSLGSGSFSVTAYSVPGDSQRSACTVPKL